MRKAILTLGTFLLFIGASRLLMPQLFTSYIALDSIVAWLAIGVGTTAVVNGTTWLRSIDLRIVFRALGLTLLLVALYGINSPTFGELRQSYVPVADLFIGLESAIALLILATEKSEEAVSPLVYVALVAAYLYRRTSGRFSTEASLSRHKQA